MKSSLKAFAAVLPLLLAATPLWGQVQTGSLLVKATDEQGNTIPGVSVTISSPVLVSGQMSGVTDSGGAYRFPSLPPGIYSVKLELQRFQSVVRENLVVSVGQTTPINLALKIASVEETLTVTAESPVVDTTSANVNVTLDTQLLQKTPGGRDIWSLVEYKVPGLVTSRPDVGGAAGGLQGSMVARGTPNSQNAQFLNGINVGDPAAIGFTGYYYDYDAFDQIQVSTGAHDLSVPSSGVFLNMVTKTGGDRWAGKVSAFWQGDAIQGRNVGDNLKKFGLREDAGAVKYVSDANFQIGGPLLKNKLRLYTSFRDWRVHVNVPGFPEVEYTNMISGLANLSWQVNQSNKVTVYVSRQYYDKPNRGASANNTPLSNFKEDDRFTLSQVLWNSVLSQNAFIDARVSYLEIFFPLFQKGNDQSLFDQSTSFLDRAAQTESIFTRRRYQASANLQYFIANALGGRHELRVGIDNAYTPTKTSQHRIDDLNLFWRSATNTATEVQLFNSPVDSKATVNVTAFFVQDSYSMRNLTINAGARFERVEGYLPEQSSPASRWFPNATRRFDAIRDVPNWKTVAPRLSVAYDLQGDGKTALKAAAGRYYYTISTGTPNSVNPNFTFSETYVWNDLNRDLRFQENERGAFLRQAGSLITSFDPDIKRPYTDEASVGVDRELIPNLKLSVVLTARRERNNFGNRDVGIPFSFYTLVTRTENGRDGMPGTSDDRQIQVWDRTTSGRSSFVITNNEILDQNYRGLEITATKRFSNRWLMLAGYTWSRTRVKADAFANPNQLINSEGPVGLDRTHIFKITGSYLLPGDVDVSANFRTWTGAPVTRTATFALTQGNTTVSVEPRGSERLDYLTTLDARVAKVFKISGKELEATVDGYNLLNANTVWDVRSLTGRINVREGGLATGALINQQQFLSPTGILGPRIFRFGAAFRF